MSHFLDSLPVAALDDGSLDVAKSVGAPVRDDAGEVVGELVDVATTKRGLMVTVELDARAVGALGITRSASWAESSHDVMADLAEFDR